MGRAKGKAMGGIPLTRASQFIQIARSLEGRGLSAERGP